jgi:hypothetical protein
MLRVNIVNKKRSGLFPEHDGIAPVVQEARATNSVVELLRAAGATVEPMAGGYRITLGHTMPPGIVAVRVQGAGLPPGIALRLEHEPRYPVEYPDYWVQVDWTPCPVCGAPVVWYEAGYVPGYRVCGRPPYHHSLAIDTEATQHD